MYRAHVIRLDPTFKQEQFFCRCVGTARFVFNWALGRWKEQWAAGERSSEFALSRELNAVKAELFPWMLEVPKRVLQQAIHSLATAYKSFFASCKGTRKGAKVAPPDFKSKHGSRQSARLDNGKGTFRFDGARIKLPLIGWVRMHECLRLEGKPTSATVSHVAGRWWVSVLVEMPDPAAISSDKPPVGVDLGIATAITLSSGDKVSSPNPLNAGIEKLARLDRAVSRKVKGSSNRRKAIDKLARFHWRVAQVRRDFQHKATSAITKRFGVVCIETLNIAGLLQNRSFARAIKDVGWGELGRQFLYKSEVVVEVPRFYPSSKTCSGCGVVASDMPLDLRSWACVACGVVHDRDVNAAVNIRDEGMRLHTASCAGMNACGDGSSGLGPNAKAKLPPMKQELSRVHESTS